MNLQGIAVSGGTAVGTAFVYNKQALSISDKPAENALAEIESYIQAKKAAAYELEALYNGFLSKGAHEQADIFAAHLEILEDEEIAAEIQDLIAAQNKKADYAVQNIYSSYAGALSQSDDGYIKQRSSDLTDVMNRVLSKLHNFDQTTFNDLPGPAIIVAHELTPSDTASMPLDKVLGIATETGGPTSHAAIIARALGIPAVSGVGKLCSLINSGDIIAINGASGRVETGLLDEDIERYTRVQNLENEQKREEAKFLDAEAVTQDGIRVYVEVNIGSDREQELEFIRHSDGVGLFRSEFLFIDREELPDEESQFNAYKNALQAGGGKPVILRTLDIGGDKQVKSLPCRQEENPNLGKRALRLCLDNPSLFKTQLRAALRASMYGDLWMMFPMVSSLDDFRRAKDFVLETAEELKHEGVPYDPAVKVGTMIEIPGIAIMAESLAKEADFASIGTNDLTQYLLAADRGNASVSEYYQKYHPAVFRLISYVSQAFAKEKKPLGICGELGGDLLAIPALIGMGVRYLSSSGPGLAKIKHEICSIYESEARTVAAKACAAQTAAEACKILDGFQKRWSK